MFGAESTWGECKSGLSNRMHPEASMINWFVDIEAVRLGAGGIESALLARPLYWSREETVQDRDVAAVFPRGEGVEVILGLNRYGLEVRYLVELYVKLIPEYKTLWQSAIVGYWENCQTDGERVTKGLQKVRVRATAPGELDTFIIMLQNQASWNAFHKLFQSELELALLLGRQPSVQELGLAKGLRNTAIQFKSVTVADVTFIACVPAKGKSPAQAGDWVMARTEVGVPATVAYFGHLLDVYEHVGPDREVQQILRVDWHHPVAGAQYHPEMRMPMIGRRVRIGWDSMWLAGDVVPCICWPEPDLENPARLLTIARDFKFMKFLGYPDAALSTHSRT